MNRFLLKCAVVIAACLFASLSFAGAPMGQIGPPPGHDPAQMASQMADRLDLSDDQRSQLTALLKSEHEKVRSERAKLKNLRQQLLPTQGEFDSDAARKAADEIGVISGNLAYARAQTLSEINKILTEEQQAKLGHFLQERTGRRGEKRKR